VAAVLPTLDVAGSKRVCARRDLGLLFAGGATRMIG
jgi:hypothetical protein